MAVRGKSPMRSDSDKAKAQSYRHPEADSPLRPEIGTQPKFKTKKPPVTYRYDSSLSPALEWDGQNGALNTCPVPGRVGTVHSSKRDGRLRGRASHVLQRQYGGVP